MTTIVCIDGPDLIEKLDKYGWTQGKWESEDGKICAHQAIRLCSPQPGDAFIIEQVARLQGWGPEWNDNCSTTELMVRNLLTEGINITDTFLRLTFGPQWKSIIELIRRTASLTKEDEKTLRPVLDGMDILKMEDAKKNIERIIWERIERNYLDHSSRAVKEALYSSSREGFVSYSATVAAKTALLAILTWNLALEGIALSKVELLTPWLSIQPELLDYIERD